jgi:ABC-type transport system involved in cytochrome c biogenesis ATPase subunit
LKIQGGHFTFPISRDSALYITALEGTGMTVTVRALQGMKEQDKGKVKGKLHPRTGHEGPEGE